MVSLISWYHLNFLLLSLACNWYLLQLNLLRMPRRHMRTILKSTIDQINIFLILFIFLTNLCVLLFSFNVPNLLLCASPICLILKLHHRMCIELQYNLFNSNLRNSKTSLIRTKFHSPTAIFSLYLTPPNSNISNFSGPLSVRIREIVLYLIEVLCFNFHGTLCFQLREYINI